MSLRKKTVLTVIVPYVGLIAVLYLSARLLLLGGFIRLEERTVAQHVKQATSAIAEELQYLDATAVDWSSWDDTYRFAQDRNERYREDNLAPITFANLHLDILILVDAAGQVAYAGRYDGATATVVTPPGDVLDWVVRQSLPEGVTRGLVNLQDSLAMVALRPILTTEGAGPARGRLLMVRYLGPDRVEALSGTTHLTLALRGIGDAMLPDDFRQAAADPALAEGKVYVHAADEETTRGFGLLRDLNGAPVGLLRVQAPRDIYHQGKVSIAYFLISLVGLGVVFGAITLFGLEREVIARIGRLSARVTAISSSGDAALRVELSGRDELGRLASEINCMLDGLERADAAQREHLSELGVQKERLAVTLRSIADGVITTDVDGRVTLMNQVAERLTDTRQTDAIGRSLSEVCPQLHPDGARGLEKWLEQAIVQGDCVRLPSDVTLRDYEGRERTVASTAAPIRDPNNQTLGLALAIRDVTDRRRAEHERARAQNLESIGLLAAGIAHDFNNILTAVIGNIDLARRELGEGLASVTLGDALRAAAQARRLTGQLLTFAKGGSPVRRTTSIAQLTREATQFALHGGKAGCEFDLPDDLWTAEVDEGQMRQVFTNLILNAQQAMPGGGTIKVSAENVHLDQPGDGLPLAAGSYIRLSVSDEGVGIPPEQMIHVFDPYFTTKKGGTGLGLSIAYSIVGRHGGYITLDSQVGHGATFFIYLPADGKVQPHVHPAAVEPPAAGHGRLLLMDDEEMVRSVGARILAGFGYTVDLASDGLQAIEMYRAADADGQPYRAVIMDLTVPGGMGGEEAVRHVLKLESGARVIVSSGYHDDPVLADYRQFGFVGAIGKPYLIEDLRGVLEGVLNGSVAIN